MKKAQLSIQFIFLIFIATIAAVVIVGLLSNWSMDAETILRKINIWQNSDNIPDNQRVNLTTCNGVQDEVIKHSKLCYTKAKQGQMPGELCYLIIMPRGGCAVNFAPVRSELTRSSIAYTISARSPTRTISISYSYDSDILRID